MRLPVYLDYAATTPLDRRVAEIMGRFLTIDGEFGNPASHNHAWGWAARAAVETARSQVAALINADPKAIVWTSGATESINLALKGAAAANKGRHIVTAKTEHRATLDVCNHLERSGYAITYLDPEPDGLLNPERLAAALRDDTVLVSLMHVNNEIGVIQDVAAIGRLTREQGVLLHVDGAQSLGKCPLDVQATSIDLLSLSAHKIHGPKGVGALYVRRWPKLRLAAQMHGGGQEHGLRAGTLATHQIVGMGEACRIATQEMADDNARIGRLRDRLWDGLRDLGNIRLHGAAAPRAAGILNVSFADITGESLLAALPDLAVSTGSACSSANQEPSHVLRALGCPEPLARSALRFSLGRFTQSEEIDWTIGAVRHAVNRLRSLSPLWDLRQQGLEPDTLQWETA
ncbi:MAG: IscS subfamily cysteine desulfurase [Gammaproteobacteria bacterium]|nr:IscS subfamily cysteine desulfurase [Gammaproteobacteria bacterium]MCP5423673.1 IscS subfamily cysteine desulfurase [Gammaproteobacteria bacterium]